MRRWRGRDRAWSTGVPMLTVVAAERIVGATVSRETRSSIASVPGARTVGEAVRAQWGIGNQLHWVSDSAFREDEPQAQRGQLRGSPASGVEPGAGEQTAKVGVKAKRLKAGWDDAYLGKILAQIGH